VGVSTPVPQGSTSRLVLSGALNGPVTIDIETIGQPPPGLDAGHEVDAGVDPADASLETPDAASAPADAAMLPVADAALPLDASSNLDAGMALDAAASSSPDAGLAPDAGSRPDAASPAHPGGADAGSAAPEPGADASVSAGGMAEAPPSGCGCSSAPSVPLTGLTVLGLLLRRRRAR